MKVLKICVKCSDTFAAILVEDGIATQEYEGYVPKFMPEEHYGDYVELDIDIATGNIVNWRKPTLARVKKELNEK